MKNQLLFALLCLAQMTFAHNIADNGISKHWTIVANNATQELDGYFSHYQNGSVFIEKENHCIFMVLRVRRCRLLML